MSNPWNNLGTPPHPTHSSSSTNPQPSSTPKPRKRRVKMLARKTVASSALSQKLNAQLQASQAQNSQNSSDSFKSATEGEETRSSDSEHVTSVPKPSSEIISEIAKNLEIRFILVGSVIDVKMPETRRRGEWLIVELSQRWREKVAEHTGGSGSGEAAEGLVNLGKQADEPGLSVEETLADLLKKLSDSYQPKKKGTTKATTSGTAIANKKRKTAPSETSDISLPRGRTTRSKLKQSEKELQRALEESKKKRVDKGKEKVVEHVEAVELDEMDLVHQSEKVAEVEVQTPKPKKAKTSSKKSSSVSKSVEPSISAKRPRYAVKAKQVKITKEDDWSGEEDDGSDGEKDKLTKFGKRTFLKGRLLKDLEEEGMIFLLEKLEIQGWKDMVLQLDGTLASNEIVE
ncbi:uncharacterized protein [Nicotiana tomentosiformis]|uniref:uncharacterized protein n=1 Tax=Nicotiana tomentosiformis TaxID=4098 RepID=UPI00388CDBB1